MKLHPVNRIVAGVFWILGWGFSYYAMYFLAMDSGRVQVINQFHYQCISAKPFTFGGDRNQYVCAKLHKL